MKTTVFVLLTALTLSFGGVAFAARPIPPEAVRATVAPGDDGTLIVDGTAVRLAANAVIVADTNRTIRPGRVPDGAAARVEFAKDGSIRRVWLLTDEEARGE